MRGRRKESESAKRTRFTNNEPPRPVSGGPFRESTRVAVDILPAAVQRRRELNRALAVHCGREEAWAVLAGSDEGILHLMSREIIATGSDPTIRRRAIEALARFQSPATMNVLAELADNGEDEFIRSDALRALGAMGLRSTLSTVVQRLADRSDLVRNAAAVALRRCAMAIGTAEVVRFLRETLSGSALAEATQLLEGSGKTRPRRKKAARSDGAQSGGRGG